MMWNCGKWWVRSQGLLLWAGRVSLWLCAGENRSWRFDSWDKCTVSSEWMMWGCSSWESYLSDSVTVEGAKMQVWAASNEWDWRDQVEDGWGSRAWRGLRDLEGSWVGKAEVVEGSRCSWRWSGWGRWEWFKVISRVWRSWTSCIWLKCSSHWKQSRFSSRRRICVFATGRDKQKSRDIRCQITTHDEKFEISEGRSNTSRNCRLGAFEAVVQNESSLRKMTGTKKERWRRGGQVTNRHSEICVRDIDLIVSGTNIPFFTRDFRVISRRPPAWNWIWMEGNQMGVEYSLWQERSMILV